MTTTTQPRWTVNAIKTAMRTAGSHYFDPGTMRFFGTKVSPVSHWGPGGIYFVTSEKPPHGPRASCVRQFMLPASIDTIGEVASLSGPEAHRQAELLANTALKFQWATALLDLDSAVTDKEMSSRFDSLRHYPAIDDARHGEIIYFAGDEGYTRAKAVEYSDHSGMHLELIQTGATDRWPAWNASYKLRQEVCRVLWAYATDSFSQDISNAVETFKEVTIIEQFMADLDKHSAAPANVTVVDAKRIITHAKNHHQLMERLCSDRDFCKGVDAEGRHPQITDCRARIRQAAKRLGASGVVFSGDPRGCTVKLTFTDGFQNDMANEGYCVPISEREE